MADNSNPFTDSLLMQGWGGIMGPNPYLQYTGKIPMAGFYGQPTNAQGNVPQSFTDAQAAHDAWRPPAQPAQATRGTTANSTGGYINPAIRAGANADMLQALSSMVQTSPGVYSAGPGTPKGFWQAGQQSQQAAPPPQNPYDMRQAYLDALANPGPQRQYGAQMQPGTTPTGAAQPSVLAQFLANHPQGGGPGAGGFSNRGFFDTLNALQAQKPG